jgi:phosphoglycolate phosphatase-like HAD superfamily hydrolase
MLNGLNLFSEDAEINTSAIIDFDETLMPLAVDWEGLRKYLNVSRLGDLWDRSHPLFEWEPVRQHEIEAAETSPFINHTLEVLKSVTSFAVLTNNSEQAVATALARLPEIEKKVSLIVGRETLKGPKQKRSNFDHGFKNALDSLSTIGKSTYYLGDQDYELNFAKDLGAIPIRVLPDRLSFHNGQ